MIRLRHKLLIQLLRVLDQGFLVGTLTLISLMHSDAFFVESNSSIVGLSFEALDFLSLFMLVLGWVCIFHFCVGYRSNRLATFKAQIRDFANAATLASFWLLIISNLFAIQRVNILNWVIFLGTVLLLGILSRILIRSILASARKSGYNCRYLLIVGINEKSQEMNFRIRSAPDLGYKIVGFVTETPEAEQVIPSEKMSDSPMLGSLSEFREILEKERVDEILVCLQLESRFSDAITVIQHAKDLGIVVRFVAPLGSGDFLKHLHIEELGGEYIATLFREKMLLQLLFKRLIDLTVSVITLILLLPLFVVIAILIKFSSKGSVFFAQERVRMNQRRFRLYKFRSMVADAEKRKSSLSHLNERDGPVFKIENDPRITKIGKFIRKTSIDELPQLWNVLCGEMSLVGPRPPTPDEVEKYEWLFRKRLSVKPGITCLWQISGRKEVTFEQWMEMDQTYIDNWSVWLDIKILFKTFPVVLLGRGAS